MGFTLLRYQMNCQSIFRLFCCLFTGIKIVSLSAAISFEGPMVLERAQGGFGVSVRQARAVGGEGLIVGSSIGAVVLTNNWIVRSGFQRLRFPLAIDYQGRIVCPSNDTNKFLTRFNPDGSVDSSYLTPGFRAEDMALISDLQAEPDGKVLVGTGRSSSSSSFDGFKKGLFRVNENGTLDSNYAPDPQGSVRNLIVLPDKKLLVNIYDSVLRLLNDGTLDPLYIIARVDGVISSMALQPDGKLVLAGEFISAAGVPGPGLARFFPSGEYDFNFAPPSTVGTFSFVKVQSDGGIVVGHFGQVSIFDQNGNQKPTTFLRQNPSAIEGIELDEIDRIYILEASVYRFSGRYRIRVEPLNLPQVLEKSSLIESGWSQILIVPANTSKDYLIPDFPGVGNTFYRARTIQ
jgi:hypothetical protein